MPETVQILTRLHPVPSYLLVQSPRRQAHQHRRLPGGVKKKVDDAEEANLAYRVRNVRSDQTERPTRRPSTLIREIAWVLQPTSVWWRWSSSSAAFDQLASR